MAMFITKRHLSRRTVLKGLGATLALPFLDAMIPAATPLAKPRRGQGAVRRHRDGARRRRQHAYGLKNNLWSPAADGPRVRSAPDVAGARSSRCANVHHHRQQHRRAEGGGVHDAGDRRRSFPRQRGLPHADASQADEGIGPARGDVVRPDLRAAIRSGHGDSVDAAVHRERRSVRRLRVRLLLRLHRRDQLGVAERAAADDARSARGLRQLFGAGATPEERAEPASRGPQHARHDRGVGRAPEDGARRQRSRAPHDYLDDVREIERRIQNIEALNRSGEQRELPGAPMGVPDSFEEHVKLMFDLQAVALRVGPHARVRVQDVARRVGPRLPGSRRQHRIPQRVAPRRARRTDSRVREDQPLPRQPGAVLPRAAEADARRRRQPARQHADHLRLADGQSEPAQPQALPAVPGRQGWRRS